MVNLLLELQIHWCWYFPQASKRSWPVAPSLILQICPRLDAAITEPGINKKQGNLNKIFILSNTQEFSTASEVK